MDFKEVMTGFAARLGLAGLAVKDGTNALDIDGMRVELFLDAKANAVMVCGVVGDGPTEESPRWNALLLQANFLFLETGGATLAQNPETKQYVLERALPLESLDGDRLVAAVESFVNELERWREMLADFRPIRGKAEAAIQEAEALPLGGFIRV